VLREAIFSFRQNSSKILKTQDRTFFSRKTTLTPSTEMMISTFFFLIPRALNSYWTEEIVIFMGCGSTTTYSNSSHRGDDFDSTRRPGNFHASNVL
jgi:hypothetical protein